MTGLALASEFLSRRRGRGNVVIPKGFPKSVGRVGSRLYGFPGFPHSVNSMACFLWGRYSTERAAGFAADAACPKTGISDSAAYPSLKSLVGDADFHVSHAARRSPH